MGRIKLYVEFHRQSVREALPVLRTPEMSENGHAPDFAHRENVRNSTALAQQMMQNTEESTTEALHEGISKAA